MPSCFQEAVRPPTYGFASKINGRHPRATSSKPHDKPASPAPTMMQSHCAMMPYSPLLERNLSINRLRA